MRPSLHRLLEHPIDYAGLFPPAEHSMQAAVTEYLEALESKDSWIVDRFICSTVRLEELSNYLSTKDTEPIRVTVVGSLEGVKSDVASIIKVRAIGKVSVDAFEVKIPQDDGLRAAVNTVKRLPKLVEDESMSIFLEVGWGEGMVDAMHDAATIFEEAGFKARTGGTTAETFPTTAALAEFISECAALECPFKFTAGLHDPIRHYDEDLGVYRHGFLNVLLAGALATSQDLNRREIETVLDLDDPSKMHFGADDIRIGEHWLEAEQIEEFWSVFGGFGSCSIQEPLDGLRKLGLLEEVGA